MTGSAARRVPAPIVVRICPNATLGFLALLSLQFVPMLGTLAAMGFLVFGLALVARRPGAVPAEVLRHVGLCLLVAWCLLSALWSDYPAVSLRHGLQLALTVVFALVLAERLSPIVLLKCLALCFLVACSISLASGRERADGLGFLGIYGSKNAMAGASSLLLIISLCLVVDRQLPQRWRLVGGLGVGLGAVLLFRANSVGAAVATAAILMALGLVLILRRLSGTQRVVAATLSILAVLAMALIMLAYLGEAGATFLAVTGKDLTLTGRTDLWQVALQEIARRPLLGAGYQAVWVPGNSLAEGLWRDFGVTSRTGFHFHNAYLSNAVEVGVIGATLQAVIVILALVGTLAWVLRDLRAETLFLALFMVRQVVLSMVEVPFFFQFDIATILTVACVVYVRRARAAAR